MKHRYLKSNLIACLLTATITGGCLFTSCEDWTDPEEVDYTIQDPSEQNPELWARYIESLRVYKLERPHYITYASFNNGIEPSKNEGDYIRSLPDSLDFVTLANSENITTADREDIPELQEKSTRVLYHVDYAKKMAELPDEAALRMAGQSGSYRCRVEHGRFRLQRNPPLRRHGYRTGCTQGICKADCLQTIRHWESARF